MSMNKSILDALQAVRDKMISAALYRLLKPLKQRYRSCVHSSAGLVIKAGGSALAKTGAICNYQAGGKNGQIASGVDMPALVGTVTADKFNIYVFTVDSAGTKYVQMGTEAATEAAVKWPALNQDRAIIGYLKVNPTGTGNFVGGQDALDSPTIFTAPTTDMLYVSPVGMFDPTAVID